MSHFLIQNNLENHNQSGFKVVHPMETAFVALIEKLHIARSAKRSSVLILRDLSASFCLVNHKTLLYLLTRFRIRDPALHPTWRGLAFTSYRFSIGVSQGLVLGPFLLFLYSFYLSEVIVSHG